MWTTIGIGLWLERSATRRRLVASLHAQRPQAIQPDSSF